MQVSAWLYLIQQGMCAGCSLAALGQVMGLKRIFPLRLAVTSLVLAFCALSAVQWPVLRLPLLMLALLVPLGAWPRIPHRLRTRLLLLHAVIGLMLAGCARLVSSLSVSPLMQLPLICLTLCLLPRLLMRSTAPACVSIRIRFQGRQLCLTALVDSGNLLRDPLTGLPVIVISRRAAARLLPGQPEFHPGMRLMRVRTIAGNTLMPILRPEQAELSQNAGWETVQALIGLSPDGYSGFQALVPSALLSSNDHIPVSSVRNKEEMLP